MSRSSLPGAEYVVCKLREKANVYEIDEDEPGGHVFAALHRLIASHD